LKARIEKDLDDTNTEYPFRWEVSHFCKQEKRASEVYKPGSTLAVSEEKAESLLILYLKNFTNISVTKNPFY